MRRMEVVCNACEATSGTSSKMDHHRIAYCINSVALDFVPRDSVNVLLSTEQP